jgi:DNA-binding NarL/FixJ family response regulator
VKILIVDDQPQARESLSRLCEHNDDVQVVEALPRHYAVEVMSFIPRKEGFVTMAARLITK